MGCLKKLGILISGLLTEPIIGYKSEFQKKQAQQFKKEQKYHPVPSQ
jgi:ADP-dependent phosphofructokinase/glucokinase